MPTSASAARPSSIGASTAAAGPAYAPSVAARVSVVEGRADSFTPEDPVERPGGAVAREDSGTPSKSGAVRARSRFGFAFSSLLFARFTVEAFGRLSTRRRSVVRFRACRRARLERFRSTVARDAGGSGVVVAWVGLGVPTVGVGATGTGSGRRRRWAGDRRCRGESSEIAKRALDRRHVTAFADLGLDRDRPRTAAEIRHGKLAGNLLGISAAALSQPVGADLQDVGLVLVDVRDGEVNHVTGSRLRCEAQAWAGMCRPGPHQNQKRA